MIIEANYIISVGKRMDDETTEQVTEKKVTKLMYANKNLNQQLLQMLLVAPTFGY